MYDMLPKVYALNVSEERLFSIILFFFFLNSWNVTLKNVIKIVSEKKVECKTGSQMGAGQPGPLLAKSAGPTAKLRASGPRARSKSRPEYYVESTWYVDIGKCQETASEQG